MVRAYRWQWSAICFFCFSPIIRAANGYGYSYNRNLFAFSRVVYEKHAVHEKKRAVHEKINRPFVKINSAFRVVNNMTQQRE